MRKQLLLVVTLLLFTVSVAAALPEGANVTVGAAETKTSGPAESLAAEGGNVTEVNITATPQTLAWQGFYGEVTGNITLSDASNDQLYSWPLNLSGEVYATTASSVDFTTVSGVTDCTTDESLTGTGSDRVSNTFTNAALAQAFEVGEVSISQACRTYTYVNSAAQTNDYEQVILAATGVNSIYATRINPDTTGFDGATHDYQMIVPDSQAQGATTYYFYVEFA